MDYKGLIAVAAIFLFFQDVQSLKCYSCDSKQPNETCFSPIDKSKIPSVECNATGNTRSFASHFSGDVDPEIEKRAQTTSDYECIVYEKFHFSDNKTETFRDCVKKIDYCRILTSGPEAKYYNLTRCATCTSDHCNSSNSLQISAFLCLFVLILGTTFK